MMIDVTLGVNLAGAKAGTQMSLFTSKVQGVAELPMTGTFLLLDGGTTLPVKETKEQILTKIKEAKDAATTGTN
jgi:hypothetical protein